jgi:molybdate transport system substrate-binding protein
MNQKQPPMKIVSFGIILGMLALCLFFAGCTGSTPQPAAPVTPVATSAAPVPAATPLAASTPEAAATPAPASTAAAETPAPVYTSSEGNVIAYTAASLKGVSPKLAADFEKMYPGHKVVFNLAGTQALKTQIQNGAYADVFISASNTYTNELKSGGYFVDGTVQPLTTNYVIVILPSDNPAGIQSLSDLAKPGIKIAMGDKSVPAGTAAIGAIANLAKSTYTPAWNASVFKNVVTYETSEPGVAAKVALGEVDAGFVYESTYTAAKSGTYTAITIPRKDNYLQTYTIGILKESTNKGAAADFENFMLSSAGQQDLRDYGFRSL